MRVFFFETKERKKKMNSNLNLITPLHLQKICTQFPYHKNLQTRVAVHRTRYLQFDKLQEEESKALAETFGENSSEIFRRTIQEEILDKNLVEGKLLSDYSAEMLIEDFQNILKDVMTTTQNAPTLKSFQQLIPLLPSQLISTLESIFKRMIKEFHDKIESVIPKEDFCQDHSEKEAQREVSSTPSRMPF